MEGSMAESAVYLVLGLLAALVVLRIVVRLAVRFLMLWALGAIGGAAGLYYLVSSAVSGI